jgi:hypothetical protein
MPKLGIFGEEHLTLYIYGIFVAAAKALCWLKPAKTS